MDSLYEKTNQKNPLGLYRDYLRALPEMLQKDSSLLDDRLLLEIENRVTKLENEKALQANLLERTRWFNYSLLIFSVLMLLLTGFIFWTLRKLQVKNKKIALQSLRREMNPHFIFNSLNSVNHFIAQNRDLDANRYLTRFSGLMRSVLEHSKEDFIHLEDELALVRNYLELEHARFPEKFDYNIVIDEALPNNLLLPTMLIQPLLENAVWHGLRYRESAGVLRLELRKLGDRLEIKIEDNGIGIAKSKAQKTENQKKREGRGMRNTEERIQLLNQLYQCDIRYEIVDKTAPDQGVVVTVNLKPKK